MSRLTRLSMLLTFVPLVAAASCIDSPETALGRLVEARRIAADLQVRFTKAADASNRAVMAVTDEESTAFAREANEMKSALAGDITSLDPLLEGLGYSEERALLSEFGERFERYQVLDVEILGLAVENTNLKAQRLSFGKGQEEADALEASIGKLTGVAGAGDAQRVQALAATAVANVRTIQVLQAPHIAESEDAAMTRMEEEMREREAAARSALKSLSAVVPPGSRPDLDTASAALDRFIGVHREILTLSRRNSNVRSLALTLGQKRTLTAVCDESLQALQEALAKRGFAATR